MATPGAEFVTFDRKAQLTSSGNTEAELQELEKEIARSRDWPIHSLLNQVVSGVSSITHADGAAIAVCDQWGVICRASVGEAPEVGSRLRPDSALTRECFETGQVVVCEDAENDYRVRRSTANNLAPAFCCGRTSAEPRLSSGSHRDPVVPSFGLQPNPYCWIAAHRPIACGYFGSRASRYRNKGRCAGGYARAV